MPQAWSGTITAQVPRRGKVITTSLFILCIFGSSFSAHMDSQAEVAKTFAVSVATIKRSPETSTRDWSCQTQDDPWSARSRKEPCCRLTCSSSEKPLPMRRGVEHCQMFEATYGIAVSPASITRARAALGWTRKKELVQKIRLCRFFLDGKSGGDARVHDHVPTGLFHLDVGMKNPFSQKACSLCDPL